MRAGSFAPAHATQIRLATSPEAAAVCLATAEEVILGSGVQGYVLAGVDRAQLKDMRRVEAKFFSFSRSACTSASLSELCQAIKCDLSLFFLCSWETDGRTVLESGSSEVRS